MPKIQKSNKPERYFITIPKDLILQKGWEKGKSVFFLFNERGNIELTDKIK